MGDIIDESLYKKQNMQFERTNYARKRELSLEILRYPFKDDELWAFTFIKKGTIFLCVNSDLPVCKQIFAMAHELYHIHCYAEDINTNTITGGSLLDSRTADEEATSQEDLEANAFAGLLLMPDASVIEQFKMFWLSKEKLDVDGVIILMDIFALPYKAVILRLVESGIIEEKKARELLKADSKYITDRIKLTGKAERWQKDSNDLIYYGSLLENLKFNSEHDLLVNTREKSDRAYLEKMSREFRKER